MSVRLRLPARLDSVRRARAALDRLDPIVGQGLAGDLRVAREQACHQQRDPLGMDPGQCVELRVEARAESVRVEVPDPGPGVAGDPPTEPSPERVGGRGLWLVDRLASPWGVRPGSPSCVWLEIDRLEPLRLAR